jgi:8-oxo-dGTP pyrophosphatase MutT (NUDIX family)
MIRGSQRTRVIVRCGDKVLLLRSRFGSQEWALPGGGLHKGEQPELGAARELKEEAGIELEPSSFRLLSQGIHRKNQWHHFNYWLFEARVSDTSHRPQRFEILETQWFDVADLPENISTFTREVALPLLKK